MPVVKSIEAENYPMVVLFQVIAEVINTNIVDNFSLQGLQICIIFTRYFQNCSPELMKRCLLSFLLLFLFLLLWRPSAAQELTFIATEVCAGDTTLLTAIVNTADSVVLITWDLDGNGQFGDAYGDTVRHIYPHAGTFSVGARLTTLPGNISTVYQSVMVGDEPVVDFVFDQTCAGLPTLFTPQIGLLVSEPDTFTWEFGDHTAPSNIINPEHFFPSPGIFNVTLSVISTIGCESSISKDVLIHPLPAFNLMWSNDTVMIQGDSIILTVQGNVDSVLWSNGHRGTQIVVHQPGYYAATAYRYGCYDTKGVNVSFRETTTAAMLPNVITANGDGFNDCWVISDRTIARPVEVSIFNRLGQVVFFSTDYNDNWCGSKQGAPLPPGTYYYIVKLPGNRVIQGYVDLLR